MRYGVVALYEALGEAMTTPERRPMRRDSIFDLASLTKAVATATAIMSLVEQGHLRLNDPIESFLPQFRGPWKSEVTIWHLLTHTSGLPLKPELHHDYPEPAQLRSAIYNMPLLAPPGQAFNYTCLGFHLLADVVERVSAVTLDTFLHNNVFGPLKMEDTGFRPPAEKRERIVATEHCRWRGQVMWGTVHDENCDVLGGVSGNAGLFSTAWDLAIFAQMMLNQGEYAGRRILSPLTVQAMFKNHTPQLNASRGLGWALQMPEFGDLLGPLSIGHTGFTGTSLCLCPSLDLAVILLTNRVHPSRENNKIDCLRPLFHNAIAGAVRA